MLATHLASCFRNSAEHAASRFSIDLTGCSVSSVGVPCSSVLISLAVDGLPVLVCFIHRRQTYIMCMVSVHCLQISYVLLFIAHRSITLECIEVAIGRFSWASRQHFFIDIIHQSHQTAAARECVFITLNPLEIGTSR